MARMNIARNKSTKKPLARNKSAVQKSENQKAADGKKARAGGWGLELPKELLLEMHRLMVKSRVLEERLIKIYKAGEAYFWIGGPGEEAFGVPLGLLTKKGQGPEYDYLHLHYRCSPTMVALGMPMIDAIRLIMNRATDRCTGGRNFANHYCFPEWNVVPVSSPIEVQYTIAIGTAWAQRRRNGDSITIVSGGDAGTAEGDFASCLVWASRKGSELPMLITVQNNGWGISTPFQGQHGETHVADRGKAFNLKTMVINGNDPVESYVKIQEAMEYIRRERKPILMETMVSRLYGHSSADGLNRRPEEDCLELFEQKLIKSGLLTDSKAKAIWDEYEKEAREAQEQVRQEPPPSEESIWDHMFVDNENGDWRKF
ncbi:MAG: thiamine pyrophosphate-dependent dehydrogenase E1 component subunit alpha [Bdellovibrionales bacterium]|nr:thiamine pyrophosphate-dependent dehydrogenase E1 component subunit alpha [Bdellovibrionales bacterium]